MEALAALEQTREAASPRAMPPWIQDAVREIEAAFPMSPRLTDLAARTGVHRIYFARRFRQHLGCSVGTYIRRLRLRMAADALAHGRGSLAGTAQLAGFADQPHFTRVFRSETGFTPARYFRAVKTVGFHHSRPTSEPTSD
jgi:AraC family transcriptional regulator